MPGSAGGALGVTIMLRGRGRGAGRGARLGEADGGGEAVGVFSKVGDAGLFRGAGVGAALEALVALGGGQRLGSIATFPI